MEADQISTMRTWVGWRLSCTFSKSQPISDLFMFFGYGHSRLWIERLEGLCLLSPKWLRGPIPLFGDLTSWWRKHQCLRLSPLSSGTKCCETTDFTSFFGSFWSSQSASQHSPDLKNSSVGTSHYELNSSLPSHWSYKTSKSFAVFPLLW